MITICIPNINFPKLHFLSEICRGSSTISHHVQITGKAEQTLSMFPHNKSAKITLRFTLLSKNIKIGSGEARITNNLSFLSCVYVLNYEIIVMNKNKNYNTSNVS